MRGFLERVQATREHEHLAFLAELDTLDPHRKPPPFRPTHTCQTCQKPFVSIKGKASKFCSAACYDSHRMSRRNVCGQCGASFKATHPSRRKFCSLDCYGASLRKATP